MHKEANKSLEPINVAFVLEFVAVVFHYEDQRCVSARKKQAMMRKKIGINQSDAWNKWKDFQILIRNKKKIKNTI